MKLIQTTAIKVFAFCTIATFFLGIKSITAQAHFSNETEPNNTMETAETMAANNEKPSGVPDGKREGQNIISGYVDNKDTDWFKVLLKSGTNYMTCYGQSAGSFSFRITNSEGETLLSDVYSKTGRDLAVYRFEVPEFGYYYVEIVGTKTDSVWYDFMIGSPTYELEIGYLSCEEGSITMTSSGGTRTAHFDGSTMPGLPADAVVSDVRMTGVSSTAASSILLENREKGFSFNLTNLTWYGDDLISMNLPLDSMWIAQFGYRKAITFTPVLRVNYVYPVYE